MNPVTMELHAGCPRATKDERVEGGRICMLQKMHLHEKHVRPMMTAISGNKGVDDWKASN